MSDNMTLVVKGFKAFAREITYEGKEYKVLSASVYDEIERSRRLEYLLTELVADFRTDIRALNDIGFSKEDAKNIGISIDGLENINIPADD